jgi:hypothetical protein
MTGANTSGPTRWCLVVSPPTASLINHEAWTPPPGSGTRVPRTRPPNPGSKLALLRSYVAPAPPGVTRTTKSDSLCSAARAPGR